MTELERQSTLYLCKEELLLAILEIVSGEDISVLVHT